MEINERNSCTGKFRHIDIRYFFIKDPPKKRELSIMNYPTHLMLADSFTKPLQGDQFHKFRDIIMGRVSPYILLKDIYSYSSNKRVGYQIPGKQIPFKNIPSKKQSPSGETNLVEE